MFKTLTALRWKEFTRVGYMGSGALNSAGGIVFFISIAVNYLLLAFFLGFILNKLFPDFAPVVLVNKYLIYVFLIDFVARFFTQSLQKINLRSFLLLPVKRENLSKYLIGGGFLELGNVSILFFLIPFGLRSVQYDFGLLAALAWIVAVFLFAASEIMIVSVIKRKFGNKPIIGIIPIIAIVIFLFLEFYFGIDLLRGFSVYFFGLALFNPLFVILFVLLLYLTFFLCTKFYNSLMYLDNEKVSYSKLDQLELSYFEKFGVSMKLVQQDLRLILRNKRPRAILFMSIIFLFYGLIFFLNPERLSSPAFLLFIAIFSTGIFVTNYGQFILAWESENFDFYLSNNVSFYQFYQAKYLLMAFFIGFATFFFSFYGFFDPILIVYGIVAGLYNLGVNIPLMLWFSVYNRKRIDLSKGASFNYEGFSASHYLVLLPSLLGPFLIYFLVKFISSTEIALASLALLGVLGILFRNHIIAYCSSRLKARKYIISNAFRQIG
ncbi:MAG: DUF5687 family protein [Luteibaculaceae bacterium]